MLVLYEFIALKNQISSNTRLNEYLLVTNINKFLKLNIIFI